VDYADLPVIDLSKAKTADGRSQLAKEVVDAMTTQGFFYVINHGYTSEQVPSKFAPKNLNPYSLSVQTKRIFDIANLPFEHVGESEKHKYHAAIKSDGSFRGYKPREFFVCPVSIMRLDRGFHIVLTYLAH
jgi:isopenicillin N synthase-like dioxygenase